MYRRATVLSGLRYLKGSDLVISQSIKKRIAKLEAAIIPKKKEIDPDEAAFLESDPIARDIMRELYAVMGDDVSLEDSPEAQEVFDRYLNRYREWRQKNG
jgi:hypothetical protein